MKKEVCDSSNLSILKGRIQRIQQQFYDKTLFQ